MSDLINRTELIEEIKSLKITIGGKDIFPDIVKDGILNIINEQPTEQGTIIQGKLDPYAYKKVYPRELEIWIEQVEEALGFKLFFWQKKFIERGTYRRIGKTTAEILRELWQIDQEALDYTGYNKFDLLKRQYCRNLLEIKAKLDAAGVPTREVKVDELS